MTGGHFVNAKHSVIASLRNPKSTIPLEVAAMPARLAPLEPPFTPAVDDALRRLMGPVDAEPLALFRTIAHHDALLDRFRATGATLLSFGRLPADERETLIQRTTARCGAAYEWGVHAAAFAPGLGLGEDWLRATWLGDADDPAFSERQALLVRLADELHDTGAVSDGCGRSSRRAGAPTSWSRRSASPASTTWSPTSAARSRSSRSRGPSRRRTDRARLPRVDVSAFAAPSSAEFAAAEALLAPWRALTDPRLDGFEHLPADGRYLLVGNHTTLGVFDVPFLVLAVHRRTGVLVRSLGEHQHYRVPLWRDLLSRFGTIDGTRENTRAVMRAGEPVLVFPGGGREVARRRARPLPARVARAHRLRAPGARVRLPGRARSR